MSSSSSIRIKYRERIVTVFLLLRFTFGIARLHIILDRRARYDTARARVQQVGVQPSAAWLLRRRRRHVGVGIAMRRYSLSDYNAHNVNIGDDMCLWQRAVQQWWYMCSGQVVRRKKRVRPRASKLALGGATRAKHP